MANEQYWRRKALLAKIEVTYGTDAVPTGAVDAIRAQNVTLRPIEGGSVTREPARPFLGSDGEILVDTHVALEFEVEAAGAGGVATAPKYGPLMRACGLTETITPITGPVEYDPVSAAFESVTIYLNIDGTRYAMLGARGNVEAVLRPSELPRLRFRFLGLFVAPAAAALPVPDVSAFQAPLPANDANTTFTLHAHAGVMEELTVDLGNTVNGRFFVNSESIVVGDRVSRGSARIQAPALATKDFFAAAVARARGVLQAVHGTVAGNIFQIDAPAVEIGRPTVGETQGVKHLVLPLLMVPTAAGDDEVKFSTK